MWCSGLQPLNHTPVQTHTHTHSAELLPVREHTVTCLKSVSPQTTALIAGKAALVRQQHFRQRHGWQRAPPDVDGLQQSAMGRRVRNGLRGKIPLKPPPTKTPLFSLTWPWKPGRRKFVQAGDFLRFDRQPFGLLIRRLGDALVFV